MYLYHLRQNFCYGGHLSDHCETTFRDASQLCVPFPFPFPYIQHIMHWCRINIWPYVRSAYVLSWRQVLILVRQFIYGPFHSIYINQFHSIYINKSELIYINPIYLFIFPTWRPYRIMCGSRHFHIICPMSQVAVFPMPSCPLVFCHMATSLWPARTAAATTYFDALPSELREIVMQYIHRNMPAPPIITDGAHVACYKNSLKICLLIRWRNGFFPNLATTRCLFCMQVTTMATFSECVNCCGSSDRIRHNLPTCNECVSYRKDLCWLCRHCDE